VACEYTKAAGNHTNAGSVQDITGVTLVKDTHNKMNTSTGVYTVPVAGWYIASCSLVWNSTHASESQLYVYHGSIAKGFTPRVDITSNGRVGTASFCAYCAAGDTIKFAAYQNTGGNFAYSTATYMSIHRVSGPSQIATSEFVGVKYNSNAGHSIPDNNYTVVNFEDKIYDTHGAVTTGAGWAFTCPVAGKYSVHTNVTLSDTSYQNTDFGYIEIRKNNITQSRQGRWEQTGAFTQAMQMQGSDILDCAAGDTINVGVYQNNTANNPIALITTGHETHITIAKIS
jgi:hypothetical protein